MESNRDKIKKEVLSNIDKPWREIAQLVNDKFGNHFHAGTMRTWCQYWGIKKPPQEAGMKGKNFSQDLDSLRGAKSIRDDSRKYKEALKRISVLEEEIASFEKVKAIDTFTIQPKKGQGNGEGTIVVLASDWHIEERVSPETINGLNTYNLDIAKKRATEFFRATLRLTQILDKDIDIHTMVLALLGDFLSGDIHEEMLETAQLEPVLAIVEVQKWLASGIQFLLDNSELNLVIPCHSGNHARTTKETRYATEAGHSLEYVMYHMLADHFRGNKRVKFIIPRSYHSFVSVYGEVIRFHHGHMIRYGGGVGGLTIPVNKAIAQWNKSRKDVTLDCFGHWHTRLNGGNFIANGSNIGFNAFAVAIKASYDKPSQTLFLVDSKRGVTCTWPILYTV